MEKVENPLIYVTCTIYEYKISIHWCYSKMKTRRRLKEAGDRGQAYFVFLLRHIILIGIPSFSADFMQMAVVSL
jgi:hypothetical protein